MKITRKQLRKLIIETVGDGKLSSEEAEQLKALASDAYDEEATEAGDPEAVAEDALRDFFDENKSMTGEVFSFDELRAAVNDTRDYDEAPIPDDVVNKVIDEIVFDGAPTAPIVMHVDGDRSKGWRMVEFGY